MPQPDVPCAECGKLLYGSPSSLPAGRRTCQPCRRARAIERTRLKIEARDTALRAEARKRSELTTTQRGYDRTHRILREWWRPKVETGLMPCATCGEDIEVGGPWDLGHTEDRTGWKGPEHQACNRSTTKRGCKQTPWRREPIARRRNCENCGCEFRATYREQRFCSRSCFLVLRRRMAQQSRPDCKIECRECGQVFIPRPNQKICSERCRKKRKTRLVMDRYHSDSEFRARTIGQVKASYRRRSEAGVL